jgi:hypothetical protein
MPHFYRRVAEWFAQRLKRGAAEAVPFVKGKGVGGRFLLGAWDGGRVPVRETWRRDAPVHVVKIIKETQNTGRQAVRLRVWCERRVGDGAFHGERRWRWAGGG